MSSGTFRMLVPVYVTCETDDGGETVTVTDVVVDDCAVPPITEWTHDDEQPLDQWALPFVDKVAQAEWPGWRFGW